MTKEQTKMQDQGGERVTLYLPKHREKLRQQANAAGMSPSAYIAALIDLAQDYGWGIPPEADDDTI